jgi:hypothetical protein
MLVSALSLGASLGLTGCQSIGDYHGLTVQLWEERVFAHFKVPAPDPHSQLFQSKDGTDVLVTYDEVTEDDSGRRRRRAFFLNDNLARLDQRRRPHFVDPRAAAGLKPIPILPEANAAGASPGHSFAVSTNGCDFILFKSGQSEVTFKLPTYETTGGKVERVLVTPLAIAGDLTTIAVVVGVIGAFAYAQSLAGGYRP